MNIADCFYLGKITKPFGYKGDLIFYLDVDDVSLYKDLDSVFIEIKQRLVPFFIESIQIRRQDAIVKLEDVSAEEAIALINNDLYLPIEVLPKLEGNKFYYHEVIGFEVEDVNHGSLGKLIKINDNSAQAVCYIENENGKEILVPLIDEFLIEVDRKNKKFIVKAPEGLIDFYLNL